ncbi:MAG: hypothetical protein RL215_408, partial [Planctomycetota bacterium]
MCSWSLRRLGDCSEVADGDECVHCVGLSGLESHCTVADVGCFDTEHLGPFMVAEIGHALAFVDPWIPDDGGLCPGLTDGDCALPAAVCDLHRVFCLLIDAICFAGECDGNAAGCTVTLAGDFIEEWDSFESGDFDGADIGDGEVGMQGSFE